MKKSKYPKVIITGSSSGIGLSITKKLSSSGYFVYATARKELDVERLNKIDNVRSVRLDVRSDEDINILKTTV